MATGLSTFGRRLLGNESALDSFDCPVLLWERHDGEPDDVLLLSTASGQAMTRPRSTEPLVFEIRKTEQKANAFALAVTIGRTENNDIVLVDHSVSRFHAYLQQDGRTGDWKLIDAESKNGTWLGPLRLTPSVAETVADRSRLRFGDVELLFMLPQTFVAFVKEKLRDA